MLGYQTLRLLDDAAHNPQLSESIGIYLDLRHMIADSSQAGRMAFQTRFSNYYGLQYAGLTDEWKARYFELLFGFDQIRDVEPYQFLLLELYNIPRRQGDPTLQFSFVSKLVAFHDENCPLWDSKVRDFFGLGPPNFGCPEFRIAGFVENLGEITRRYATWTQDRRFADILANLRSRHPGIAFCHPARLCDFLVHNARLSPGAATAKRSP